MGGIAITEVMSTTVVSVNADTPFRAVVDAMEAASVSAVPVVDRDNRVLGVVSETDLMYKLEFAVERPRLWERLAHRHEVAKAAGVVARDLMSTPAVSVSSSSSVKAAVHLMESTGVHRLPVVNDLGRLVGMVTRHDVLRVFLRPDVDIARDVTTEALPPGGTEDITADVHDGVVALDGEVEMRSTANGIAEAAGGVEGVVTVENRIAWRQDDNPLARVGLG